MKINIPDHLVDAVDKYVNTNWKDGRDPSKFGALNAVAYIGSAWSLSCWLQDERRLPRRRPISRPRARRTGTLRTSTPTQRRVPGAKSQPRSSSKQAWL